MNLKSKKELIVLAVILGLLSVSIYSQMGNPRSAASVIPAPKHSRSTMPSHQQTEVLQVQLLDNPAPDLSGVKRNIFQFGSRSIAEEKPAPVVHIPQSQPIVPLVPELPDVHYLGFYFEKETGLMLAAIVNGGKVYVGKVGQILGGKYEILEIASDHVILRLTQDGKVLSVPLGKGSPNVVNWAAMGPNGEGQ